MTNGKFKADHLASAAREERAGIGTEMAAFHEDVNDSAACNMSEVK